VPNPFPSARKPRFKMWIDFGPEIGERKTSAQITVHYTPAALIVTGRVMRVVNFPPAPDRAVSCTEVLLLGVDQMRTGESVLMRPRKSPERRTPALTKALDRPPRPARSPLLPCGLLMGP